LPNKPLLLPQEVEIARQLFRFAIVGLVATASYYVTMRLFMLLLGAPLPQAHLAATILSLLVSYVGHHGVQVEGRHPYYFRRFCITSAALFCLPSTFLRGATTALIIRPEAAAGMVALGYPAASLALHWVWSFRPPPVEAL
jgi:putative flippase GtrA